MRKIFGGGLRQTGIIAAPARIAVDDVFLGGKLKSSHDKAKRIARMWQDLGGRLAMPTETNIVWLDLDDRRVDKMALQKAARKNGLIIHEKKRLQGRLALHYQICENAILAMGEVFKAALKGRDVVSIRE
jgi:threonine aldolase